MLLMELDRIAKDMEGRLLFASDEPMQLYSGDRLGVVGVNGSGKSTLLQVMAGLLQPDGGHVRRYGEAAMAVQFDEELRDLPLSGGERSKRKLEAALLQGAPILLADEPTSHMDMDGIAWTEKALQRHQGLVVLVSHDRELLDRVCTMTLWIDGSSLRLYAGGYSEAKRQRQAEVDRHRFQYEQYTSERKRLEAAIRAKDDRARGITKAPKRIGVKEARLGSEKARSKQNKLQQTAKALESRLERLERVDRPVDLPELRFDVNGFEPVRGKTAVRLEGAAAEAKGRPLFGPVTAYWPPGAKVGLVGPNGAGKTTLLEMLRQGAPGTGLAGGARVAYFSQTLNGLDPQQSVLEQVRASSSYPDAFIRTILARLRLRREDALKPCGQLSGGERVKAALAQLFLSGANVLLLDEPTNYLDLEAREELEEVLSAYPGTLLLASHDRRLLARVATSLLIFENGGLTVFGGTFEEYKNRGR